MKHFSLVLGGLQTFSPWWRTESEYLDISSSLIKGESKFIFNKTDTDENYTAPFIAYKLQFRQLNKWDDIYPWVSDTCQQRALFWEFRETLSPLCLFYAWGLFSINVFWTLASKLGFTRKEWNVGNLAFKNGPVFFSWVVHVIRYSCDEVWCEKMAIHCLYS